MKLESPTLLKLIERLIVQIDMSDFRTSDGLHDLKMNKAYLELKHEYTLHFDDVNFTDKIIDDESTVLAVRHKPTGKWFVLDADKLVCLLTEKLDQADKFIKEISSTEALMYLEYLFIAQNFEKLSVANMDARRQLTKNQFNTVLIQVRDQTAHDIQVLVPFVQRFGSAMIDRFEKKFGLKFQFLSQLNDKKEKKETSTLNLEKP